MKLQHIFFSLTFFILPSTPQAQNSYVNEIRKSDLIAVASLKSHDIRKNNSDNKERDGIEGLLEDTQQALNEIIKLQLDVHEVLRGENVQEISLTGSVVESVFGFTDHKNYRFWLFDGGSCRTSAGYECFPRMVPRKKYLLLLRKEGAGYTPIDSARAVEYISDNGDAWLQEVRRIISIETSSHQPAGSSKNDCEEEIGLLLNYLNNKNVTNPEKDAENRYLEGDSRFIGVMGFVLEIPGVSRKEEKFYLDKYGYELVEGTSDFVCNDEHLELSDKVYRYAESYNTALLAFINKQD